VSLEKEEKLMGEGGREEKVVFSGVREVTVMMKMTKERENTCFWFLNIIIFQHPATKHRVFFHGRLRFK